MAHAADVFIPQYLSPQPLYPSGCEALLGDDFIMVAEFAEVEGPRPIKLISLGLPNGVDVNHLAMKVLPVDHHFYHPRDSFTVAKDVQLLMSDSQFDLTLLVHSFKLYDIAARGYVRPLCVTYGSRDHHKMSFLYEELSKLLYEAVGVMKDSNRIVFLNDLEQHYAHLVRLLAQWRWQCRIPAARQSESKETKQGESCAEADSRQLLTEQRLWQQEEPKQQLLLQQGEEQENEQEELEARRQQSHMVETALSEIGLIISGLGGKSFQPDLEAELALCMADTESPASGFSSPDISLMSSMLFHKPASSALYDIDELCPKACDAWKLLESMHKYYERTLCEILCHKNDFLISAPSCGLLVRGTGEPLVNCLLNTNGQERMGCLDVRDASQDDDSSLNDRFYSVGSDAAVWRATSSVVTAIAAAATAGCCSGSTPRSACSEYLIVARSAAATAGEPQVLAGSISTSASVDVVSYSSCSSADLERPTQEPVGELCEESTEVPGNFDSLDRCVSDGGWAPLFFDACQQPTLPQPTVELADGADGQDKSQSDSRRIFYEALPAESSQTAVTPHCNAPKEDTGSSRWSDDRDGSLGSGGGEALGSADGSGYGDSVLGSRSLSPIGWPSSSAVVLPLPCSQLTRPHLTSEVPEDMQAFLRKPDRHSNMHEGILLRLAVELPSFPVLVHSLLVGRPVLVVADVESLPRTDDSCSSAAGSTVPPLVNPGRPLDQQLLAVVRALETLVPSGGRDRSRAVAAPATATMTDNCIAVCVYQSHVASTNSPKGKTEKQSSTGMRQLRNFRTNRQGRPRTSAGSYAVSLSDACQHKIIGVFREKSTSGATLSSSDDADFAVAPHNVLNHVTVVNLSTKCLRGPTYAGSLSSDLRRFRKEKELHRAEALRLYLDRVSSALAMKAFVLYHSVCRFWSAERGELGARSQYAAKRKEILSGLSLHADDAEVVQYMASLVDRQQAEYYLRSAWKGSDGSPAGSAAHLIAPWMNVSNKPCKVYGRRGLLSSYLFKR